MPKYYVCSGDIRSIIDRPNHKRAAEDCLKSITDPNVNISVITMVNEQGFDSDENSMFFSTVEILKDCGELDYEA